VQRASNNITRENSKCHIENVRRHDELEPGNLKGMMMTMTMVMMTIQFNFFI
jgi:hypothetical protein